jgi:nucleoside-diphosphate-sugar epimerase
MRVFVAGASGAIGRPLLKQLIAAGHEVTGMTRSEEKAEAMRAAGGDAVVCDVFDAEALRGAVAGARPEVVVHLLTDLPHRFNPKDDYLAPTNRIRTEGTRNLIAAAQAAGARRLIAESVAFLYAPEGDWVKDEDAQINTEAPGHFGTAMRALADLETQVLWADGIDGTVLRFGWFYGPGTHFDRDGSQAEEAHRRRLPIVGKGDGTFSFIHVEDAAGATLAAIDRAETGIYNVVDDEPAPMREWVPVFAELVGAKKPLRMPVWLVRVFAGSAVTTSATRMRGASNAKIKGRLGWEPRHPSWRQGFEDALSQRAA